MDILFGCAILVSAAAMYFIVRGVDVRLVLFCAAILLAAFAGQVLNIADVFFKTMGDGKIIGPICSAMGFAFVLRATGCDTEMVKLLLTPLRKFRWLLIPGGCAVGFFTNMAITSQTAAAAAVGPILFPLMTGAGFHPLVAAATLVLGCSAGGNLFNPGEPDVVTIQTSSAAPIHQVISTIAAPELAAFVVAVFVFILLSRSARFNTEGEQETVIDKTPVNFVKALLPPLPVLLLFVLMPSFRVFPRFFDWYPDGLPVVHAMLFSTVVVFIVTRREISTLTKTFFEGLGYGYTNVISLIITAACFIRALELCGVIDKLVHGIASSGVAGYISSTAATLGLAVLSGSGTAPSVAFSKAVLPELLKHGTDLNSVLTIGSLGAIGATLGRTMSPVAAVVIFASVLTNTSAKDIAKLTAIPLLCGAVAAVVLASFF